MLARVLLNVVAATNGIDAPMHLGSNRQRLRREMKNASIFIVGNFGDGNLFSVRRQRAKVVYLAPAGGIKSCTIEHDGSFALVLQYFDHLGIEVAEKRIVIIKAVGCHGDFSKNLDADLKRF